MPKKQSKGTRILPALIVAAIVVFLVVRYMRTSTLPRPAPMRTAASEPFHSKPENQSSAQPVCDVSLWQHVYHPQRLEIREQCISVSGTIQKVRREPDGDDHIQLKLDPAYAGFINKENVARQDGDLVVEPVCENPVTQADAKAACRDYHSDIVVPPVGSHVTIVGSYVLDNDHGWMEIHPATSISVIQ